jgi:hypothetical protein
MIMMFMISAIQSILFILVGNSVLGIKGMTLQYWMVLFTTSCCANMIGLNLSSALNSVITIFILIPFILIPQLLFSGVLVKYDKLNLGNISSYEYVPFIGEIMPARWSFEALAVEQFKNNRYEKLFFPYDMNISLNDWYASYLYYALEKELHYCRKTKTLNETVENNFRKLNYYIRQMSEEAGWEMPENIATSFLEKRLDSVAFEQADLYLNKLKYEFSNRKREMMNSRDRLIRSIATDGTDTARLLQLRTDYYNNWLASFTLNRDAIDMYIEKPRRIIRKFQPGFMAPTANNGRAHFFAPYKKLGNVEIDTFWFNLGIIWLVSILLYVTLYFNILQKLLSGFGEGSSKRSESSFLIIKGISSW